MAVSITELPQSEASLHLEVGRSMLGVSVKGLAVTAVLQVYGTRYPHTLWEKAIQTKTESQ